jgi:hypothetical protein
MQAEEVESLVFPSSWEVDSAERFGVVDAVRLGRSGIDGRVALGLEGFLLRHYSDFCKSCRVKGLRMVEVSRAAFPVCSWY